MCGDSTSREAVEALLSGQKPGLCVTDPPYGVEYDPGWRDEYEATTKPTSFGKPNTRPRTGKLTRHALGKVANDDRVDWREAFALLPGDVAYVWHAGVFAGQVAESLAAVNFDIRAQIIWAKQHFVFGRGAYHWQHEPCWYAVRKGSNARWIGDRSQTTVWQVENLNPMGGNRAESPTGHGTQKPVEIMARPIRNHEGEVYDPFLGSGTTMVAAENLGRPCYGMELDPKYCAVILDRMAGIGIKGQIATDCVAA